MPSEQYKDFLGFWYDYYEFALGYDYGKILNIKPVPMDLVLYSRYNEYKNFERHKVQNKNNIEILIMVAKELDKERYNLFKSLFGLSIFTKDQATNHYNEIKNYLTHKTTEQDFINAFSGGKIVNLNAIEWISPTFGAIWYYVVTKKPKSVKWKLINGIFKEAKYKQLFNQSENNGSKIDYLNTIEKMIYLPK